MADLGFGPDYISGQREALVLILALVPDGLDSFLAQLEHRLNDPGFIDLTQRSLEAETWEPDDPRIEELATALADYYLADPTLLGDPVARQAWADAPAQYRLINNHREVQASVSARLTALTETKLRAAGVPVPHG